MRIVEMKTEFAFDRHKKVDLGLVLDFILRTPRTMAGC